MNQRLKTGLIHSGLFIVTFITTTIAGSFWTSSATFLYDDGINWNYSWHDFQIGFPYSITFLLILTVHEFGHYFTAMRHRVSATLPYYIPFPPLPFFLGTLGAVIRITSHIRSKTQNFDIGIAGPLAGFVVALIALFYGFLTLPAPEYIFQIHPSFKEYGLNYAEHVYATGTPDIFIGNNILFWFFENFIGDPARVPNHHELIHYPILFASFLSLVFTSLNLLPIGQLDGGHVLYGLVGYKKQRVIAMGIFVLFLFYATLGLIVPGVPMNVLGFYVIPHYAGVAVAFLLIYFCLRALRQSKMITLIVAVVILGVQYGILLVYPKATGYLGWILFAIIIGRMMPAAHPQTEIEEPLTTGRKILGWIALVIFVLCWTPQPIVVN